MRVPVPDVLLPADRLGRVHFVGIGGAGLSGIARIMAGPRPRRSAAATATTPPFLAGAARARRRPCHLGHDAAHVGDADTLVVTTAVARGQPRGTSRRVRRGLRILPRSAGLAVGDGRPPRRSRWPAPTARPRPPSLLTVALQAAGADPTYAVGGVADRHRPQRRRRAPATCSSPRPTRATAPSWSTARTPRSSPTSRPTTSTTGAPRRPTARRSTSSPTRSTRAGFLVCCRRRPRRRRPRRAGPRPRPRRRHRRRGRRRRRARRSTSRFEGATSTFAVARRRRARRRRAADPRPPLRRSTRSPRWPSGCALGHAFDGLRARARRLHRHPAADGAQGRGRRRARLRQLRPPPRRDRAATSQAARAVAGDGRAGRRLPAAPGLAHPDLRHRDGRGARRRRRGRRARRLPRPRGRRPRGHRARSSPTPSRCPPSGSPSCPTSTPSPPALAARARPGDLVLTLGAGSVTELGPRVLELLGGADAWLAPTGAEPHRPTSTAARTRQRFARRQWARRWLAWRSSSPAACSSRSVVGGVWLVYFSSVLAVEGVEVERHHDARADAQSARRPRCPTRRAAGPGRPRRDPRPGRGAGRRRAPSTSPGSGPTRS